CGRARRDPGFRYRRCFQETAPSRHRPPEPSRRSAAGSSSRPLFVRLLLAGMAGRAFDGALLFVATGYIALQVAAAATALADAAGGVGRRDRVGIAAEVVGSLAFGHGRSSFVREN